MSRDEPISVLCEKKTDGTNTWLETTAHIERGGILCDLRVGSTEREQDKYTVRLIQTPAKGEAHPEEPFIHVDHPIARYLQHCCNPNLIIDPVRGIVSARSDIWPGEVLTFDYKTTEGTLVEPFKCVCPHKMPKALCRRQIA